MGSSGRSEGDPGRQGSCMRFNDPSIYPIAPNPLPASPREVLDALRPHVTDERYAKILWVAEQRVLDVVPVLDNLADPHNSSALLRTSDAFGIHRVHVVGNEKLFQGTHKVSRGTDRWLELIHHVDQKSCVAALKRDGFSIYVASMDGEHTPETLATKDRVAVVFGNERHGVGEDFRDLADGTYRVPMCGFVESLNVSVAAAVTLYTLVRSRPRRVSDDEQVAILARLLHSTVTDADRIVEETVRRARRTGESA
jgi:tRNA (guanosine-2'-O-)-methyltransferase